MDSNRYKPVVQSLSLEEFGDRFFRDIDDVNFDDSNLKKGDKKVFPIGWDDKHDRDLVWNTTKSMSDDYIQGILEYKDNNPINIIDLVKNDEDLDIVKHKKSKEYFRKYIDDSYKYYVFIGKNRTMTAIWKAYKGLKNGDQKYDAFKLKNEDGTPRYTIDFKLFDKQFTNEWKGEFYRAEKTIYPDTKIMLYVSYDCDINDTIYKYEHELDIDKVLHKIYLKGDDRIKYKPKELLFDTIYYEMEKEWKGTPKKRENKWAQNEKVPTNWSTNWKYVEGMVNQVHEWKNQSHKRKFIRPQMVTVFYQMISKMNDLNLKLVNPKDKKTFYTQWTEWAAIQISDNTPLCYKEDGEPLSFSQLVRGLKFGGSLTKDGKGVDKIEEEQFQVLGNHIVDSFFQNMITKQILVPVVKRKNIDWKQAIKLFFDNDRKVRVNGLVDFPSGAKWYDKKKKGVLYERWSFEKLMLSITNIDHISSLKGGKGTNNPDNLEWAIESFNKFKGKYELLQ